MARTITANNSISAWGCSVAIDDKFLPLIEKLEAQSLVDAKAYRRDVFWRAMLGYGYIFAVLSGLLLLITAIVLIGLFSHSFNALIAKLILIFAVPVFLIAKSLFVRWDAPEGYGLKPRDAPELMALIKDVRTKTKGPKPHKILITEDFNAAVTQYPRLGILGWNQNYVMLGLPLLQALSVDEVKAVLAHEFGHLSGSHNAFSAWVYRVRQTWASLSLNLGDGVAGTVLSRFFKWYGPWFNAYSFVMARADEYEADAVSVAVTNSKTVARALTRVEFEAMRQNDFWQEFWKESRTMPKPTQWPLKSFVKYLEQPAQNETVQRYLRQALSVKTDIHNTHPALADRLRAIGEAMPELSPVKDRGAERLFEPKFLHHLEEHFDQKWWRVAQENWSVQNQQFEQDKKSLETLQQKESLNEEEAIDLGLILERFERYDEALGVAVKHKDTVADKELGVAFWLLELRALLALKDEAALVCVQKILERPMGLQMRAYALEQAISAYRQFNRPEDQIQTLEASLSDAIKRLDQTREEFNSLNEKIRLEPHNLPDEAIQSLKTHCASLGCVKSIWIGLRRSRSDPGSIQYIALVEFGMFRKSEVKIHEAIDTVISVLRHHGNVFAVPLESSTRWLQSRLKSVPQSKVL